ncbi:MAG: hypothetical protein ACPG4N_06025 [Gammaproteobacteria bacterium]
MPGTINCTFATQTEPAEPVVTYVGVPIVTVNLALALTHIPAVLNVLVGAGLAQNMLCLGTVGIGDQMGLGVASGINSAGDFAIMGNYQVFMGPGPITSLATPHLQDLSNGSGFTAQSGQFNICSAV